LIHAKEWIKTYLQRVPGLYQIVMQWKARQHPVLLVRKGFTRIVIEAYPRSSNSYCVRLFRYANPEIAGETISHHSHSVSNIRHAVKWKIPVLVIVREPVKAITSNMLAVQDTSDGRLEILTTKYIDFHEWIRDNADKVVIVRFEDVVESRLRMISTALNEKFGTTFRTDLDEAALAQQSRESIELNSPNKANPNRVPLPNPEREKSYEGLRPRVRENASVKRATELYDQILAFAVQPDTSQESA
jgi:hypothetical protein